MSKSFNLMNKLHIAAALRLQRHTTKLGGNEAALQKPQETCNNLDSYALLVMALS